MHLRLGLGFDLIPRRVARAVTPGVLAASRGFFTVSGKDANLVIGRNLTASVATFALTGVAAGVLAQRSLTAGAGSFVETGQDAALSKGRTLVADVGTFLVNGEDMAPTVSYAMGAAAGSFSVTGQAATLTKSSTGLTLVAHGIGNSADNPTTGAIDTTGANLLVVSVSQYNGTGAGTLSDSKSNTWTPLTAKVGPSEAYNRLFYCASPVVGSGHTFTSNSTGLFGAIAVQAWSGANASPFDVQNGATAGSGLTIQPGSVTPSQNNSLIIASVDPAGNAMSAYLIDNGFTITDSVNSGPGVEGLAMAYLLQSTAAAMNPNWSWTGSSNDIAATIAVFKP
jgi:hypothetical protein